MPHHAALRSILGSETAEKDMNGKQRPSVELEHLLKRTKAHVAPIIELAGSSIWEGATSDDVIAQGTLTFVEWDNKTWAITCAHVIEAYRERDPPTVLSVALDSCRSIPGILRYVGGERCARAPRDLAIFEWLEPRLLTAASKKPLPLPDRTLLPQQRELVLALGYPGQLRSAATPEVASHGLLHFVGTVQAAVHDNIVVRQSALELRPNLRVGGMSGGPMLCVNGANYTIGGIVYEGIGPGDTSGEVYSDDMLALCAIPFDGSVLDSCIKTGCY